MFYTGFINESQQISGFGPSHRCQTIDLITTTCTQFPANLEPQIDHRCWGIKGKKHNESLRKMEKNPMMCSELTGFQVVFVKENCYFQSIYSIDSSFGPSPINLFVQPLYVIWYWHHWTCRGCTWPSLRWIKAPNQVTNRQGKLPISWVDYHIAGFSILLCQFTQVCVIIQFQMYYHFISKKNTTKPHRPVFEVVTPLAGWRIGRGTMGDMHNSIIPQSTNLTRCVLANRVVIYEYIHICKNRQSRINTSR